MKTATRVEYVSQVETAKLIRRALKAAFPSTKFRVRCARGGATYIDWTDGPTRSEVMHVTGEFEGETFDGMQDMRIPNAAILYANADGSYSERRYLSGLLIEQRKASDEVWADLTTKFGRMTEGATGLPVDEMTRDTFAWREFSSTSYPNGTA